MVQAIVNVVLLAVAIFLVAQFLPGIKLKSFTTGIKVAVVYSVVYFLLYKILAFFAMPFIVLTLGLFIFVINAGLLWLTDQLLDDFEIKGFGTTLVASILISLVNMGLQFIF